MAAGVYRVTTVAGVPGAAARMNVVLLHGYSMTAEDLAPFARSLGIPAAFHFPDAPMACPGGGRCWWPLIAEGQGERPRDLVAAHPPARASARATLHGALESIVKSSPPMPLVIGGFSQGAMLCCDYLLQHDALPVAGLVLLSGSRLAFDEWQPRLPRLAGLATFVSHGIHDPDLAFDAGLALEAALRQAGALTQWAPFHGGHEIPLAVWRKLKKFLLAVAGQRS
jgi:phospholipase/carboxylesterase